MLIAVEGVKTFVNHKIIHLFPVPVCCERVCSSQSDMLLADDVSHLPVSRKAKKLSEAHQNPNVSS